MRAVAKRTSTNRSSMLRDVERGVQNEISAINGAVVREGRSLKIDTPYNELVTGKSGYKNYLKKCFRSKTDFRIAFFSASRKVAHLTLVQMFNSSKKKLVYSVHE
jgi:hypothetical protein